MAEVAAEAGANAEHQGARLCTNCGTALQGKFCSSCGTAAAANAGADGWSGLTSEFLGSNGRNGIFSVALSFLRHPVDTLLRLTEDPTYRGQWTFLTAMVGMQLTLSFVILPRLYAEIFNAPSTANTSAVLSNEIVQYVGMAILTPIQYYICRGLGTIRRSPMSYVKLCALSVSFCALMASVVAVLFFVTGVVTLKDNLAIDLRSLWQGLAALVLLAIMVFVTITHKRFWGMSWPMAVGVTMFIAVLSWVVVYPGISALIERGGISASISSLLG